MPNARIIALNNTFKVLYHGIGVRNSLESGLLEAYNNIIYDSGSGYWSENVAIVRSKNLNCLAEGRNMGANCRDDDICDVNPDFVNIAAGDEDKWDLHPQSGSPAIDNGLNLSPAVGFNDDFLVNTRPIGSAWDIGVYEVAE